MFTYVPGQREFNTKTCYSFQAHKRNQGLSVTKIGASLRTSWENAWTSCCDSGSPRFNNLQDSNIATLANNFLSYFPRTRGECDDCVINFGSNFAKLRLKVQNRRRGGLCSYETEWPADQAHASFHLVTNAVMFEIDKRMQEFQNIFTLCWFMNCFFFTVSACNLLKADVNRLQQNFGYLSKSIIMRNLPICCQFLLKFASCI
jgi:hypothetical protein